MRTRQRRQRYWPAVNGGEPVQYPAWIPVLHPMTGRYQRVLCNVQDRLVTAEQAIELRTWFDSPAHKEA